MWLYNILLFLIGFFYIILNYYNENINNSKCNQLSAKSITINSKKVYLLLIFIPMILISALRSVNIGNDTDTYHQLYITASAMNWNDFIDMNNIRWEKGFLILNVILSNISSNPQLIVALSSIISLFLVFRFIYNYSENPALSIFLFITMRFFFFFMSNIRQSLAISIILLSYDYIIKKKFIPFMICVLLAAQFHSTAIVFLLAYFLEKIKNNKKVIAFIITITFVAFLKFDAFMNLAFKISPGRYSNYVNTTYFQDATNLANILNFLVTIVLIIFFINAISLTKDEKNSMFNKKKDNNELFFYFLLISVCCGLLAIRFGMFGRIQHYFNIFSIIIVPSIVKRFKRNNERIFILFLIIVCFFSYNQIIMIFRPEWQHIYPYELYFNLY